MENRQIRKVTRAPGTKTFTVSTILGTGVWTNAPDLQTRAKATFASPGRIAIDSLGNLYIADGGINSVFKTSVIQENDVTKISTGVRGWPSSIVVDRDNTVYLSTYAGVFYRIKNNQLASIGGKEGYGNQDGILLGLNIESLNRFCSPKLSYKRADLIEVDLFYLSAQHSFRKLVAIVA
jgi:hypothetical protein